MSEKKHDEQEEKIKTISIVMIIMTILMVGGAIIFFILSANISRDLKDYIEVKAEVVDFKKYEHDNSLETDWSPPTYAPIYQYEIDGSIFTHTDKVSTSSPKYEIGDEVNIFINPENPNEVITDSTTNFFFVIALAFIFFAVFSLCMGIVPSAREKGVNLVISLLFSTFGLAFMFIPGMASGYKSIGKILTAHLPFTIFGAACIAIGIVIIISMIFNKHLKRNSF